MGACLSSISRIRLWYKLTHQVTSGGAMAIIFLLRMRPAGLMHMVARAGHHRWRRLWKGCQPS